MDFKIKNGETVTRGKRASEITYGQFEVSHARDHPIHRISALQKESQHKSSGELKSWAVVLLP